MASARVQRWALMLSAYKYQVQYVPGKENMNADVCLVAFHYLYNPRRYCTYTRRIGISDQRSRNSPVTLPQIKNWTDHDPVLATIRKFVQQGWPRSVNPEFHSYHTRQLELSIQDQYLLWGSRIIIPKPGREQLLDLLHKGHPGMSKVKELARSYVWWCKIDADIEAKVKQCNQCQLSRLFSPAVPMHP